jgi:death-on-curing protein
MINYLSLEQILEIHRHVIAEFGGTIGLRDKNALESAVLRPQSGYYQTINQQAAALFESLATNHPFLDGNKRVAFFAVDVFLRMNGYYIECDSDLAFEFLNSLFSSNKFNFENLLPWLNVHIKQMNE